MSTSTRNLNTRTLLLPTSLAVFASKSITGITRSGTTATATCTSHGYSTNDWVLIQGSDLSQYNGPFQVTNTGANTFTYVMVSDPGGSSAGTVTCQKGLGATNLWGDGTTPSGSPASVGALPTALAGNEIIGKITNAATGPTTAASMTIWASDTGVTGKWLLVRTLVGSTTNAVDASFRALLPPVKFVLVFFYNAAGTAVICEAYGNEVTSGTTV